MASQRDGVKIVTINGVKQYSIAGRDYTATWLSGKKLRAVRKKKGTLQETAVLQNLNFETATTKIKTTPDGEYVIASGIYPPQVKVYEVRQLSLKFERHLVSEIINFQVLGDDYSKIAFLCADRSVCLHAKYGSHYSLRIPRMGRDIAYDCWSCDLLCAASSPNLYRINLEQGRFMSSFNTQSPAINVVSRSMVHGLVACGGEDGAVECFDLRARSSVGRISAVLPAGDSNQEVTALQFDEDGGFRMAVGSSTGKVQIYDLRSSYPIRVKDHMYGSPIVNIKWHQTLNCMEPKIISADNHIVRIWDPETGNNVTSIEPTGGAINDVCTFPESGLILLALDCSQIPSHFIPALGPAPKWCRLEQFSEDMEEGASDRVIYDGHKFLTKDEFERLNLTKLPSNLVRPDMHGFVVDYRLYKEALSLAEPFSYEAYREKKKQEKLEAERASRITIKRKLPKVNRVLAARILEDQETEDEMNTGDDRSKKKKSLKKRKELSSELLKDERFTAIFENKDFEIDELSEDYRSRHSQPPKEKRSLIEEHFEPIVEDDQEEASSDSDASAASRSSEDGFDKDKRIMKKKNVKIPRLYEVKDERHAEAFWNNVSLAEEDALPLGERAAVLQERRDSGIPSDVKLGPGGSREITFVSRSSAKHKAERGGLREGQRRGIQSLGLKPDRSHFPGRGGRGGRSGGRGGRSGRRGRH